MGGTFFLTFPAHLFNLTLHENYDAIRAWWLALPDRFRRKRKSTTKQDAERLAKSAAAAGAHPPSELVDVAGAHSPSERPTLGADPRAELAHEASRARERARFAAVVLLGALFGALLDPRFGANARTAESYVAIVATVVLGTCCRHW